MRWIRNLDPRWRRVLAAIGLFVMVVAAKGVMTAADRYRIGVNVTESLPNWAFVTDSRNRQPGRGQLVEFTPPQNPYYPGDMTFVKRVAGVAGDSVEHREGAAFVNGVSVGAIKKTDSEGRPATPGPTGIIPPGRYFVMGDDPDSLDSRYAVIGFIEQSRIIGVVEPIL